MRPIRCWILALLLALPASAQTPASIGLFFDGGGSQPCSRPPGFTPFQIHLIAFDLGETQWWEARVHWDSAAFTALSTQFYPGGVLNILPPDPPGNFLVGLGSCLDTGSMFELATLTFGYFIAATVPGDLAFCLGPAEPSTIGGMPGYANCDGQAFAFEYATAPTSQLPAGCAVTQPTNECPVGTGDQSWGALKARY